MSADSHRPVCGADHIRYAADPDAPPAPDDDDERVECPACGCRVVPVDLGPELVTPCCGWTQTARCSP